MDVWCYFCDFWVIFCLSANITPLWVAFGTPIHSTSYLNHLHCIVKVPRIAWDIRASFWTLQNGHWTVTAHGDVRSGMWRHHFRQVKCMWSSDSIVLHAGRIWVDRALLRLIQSHVQRPYACKSWMFDAIFAISESYFAFRLILPHFELLLGPQYIAPAIWTTCIAL